MRPLLILACLVQVACGLVGYDQIGTDANPSAVDADPNAPDAPPAVCGDDTCSLGETCTLCAECATVSPVCGNGICDGNEGSLSCFDDCGPEPWTNSWVTVEDEMIVLLNQHRANGTDCPGMTNAPAPALTRNAALQAISRNHAWDSSHHDYGPENGVRCNGQSEFDIMDAQGFTGFRGVAWSVQRTTATSIIDFFMAAETVCPFLMDPAITRIGAGYVDDVGGPFADILVSE